MSKPSEIIQNFNNPIIEPVQPITPSVLPTQDATDTTQQEDNPLEVKPHANGLTRWIKTQPTPGGLALLILSCVFMLWAVLPVNGKTRIQWLYLTLLNQTQLVDSSGTPIDTTNTSNQGGEEIMDNHVSTIDLTGFSLSDLF